jgi:spermidine synthase
MPIRAARNVAGVLTLTGALAAAAAAEGPRDDVYVEDRPDPLSPVLVRERIETEYNNIFIVQKGDFLSMTFRLKGENTRQSVLNLRDRGQLPLGHSHYQTLAAVYAGKLDTMLMVGLGGGSVSDYFLRHVPEMKVTSVELDPGVVTAAKKYFGTTESARHRIAVGDGRVYLQRNNAKYDVVMIDAFRGGYVPFHLLTHEFYVLLASRLQPDGVAVLNLRAGTHLFDASLVTLKRTFKSVAVYEYTGNAIVLATLQPPMEPEQRLARAEARQAQYQFRYRLAPLLKEETAVAPKETRLLTDDFAPVNLYDSIDTQKRGRRP